MSSRGATLPADGSRPRCRHRPILGPQWLAEHVLQGRHVAGRGERTHGKTTTTSMLAWILEAAGQPRRTVGGVPQNFRSRPGSAKNLRDQKPTGDLPPSSTSKFVHYRPRTAVLNNLRVRPRRHLPVLNARHRPQFHHLVRTMPASWTPGRERSRQALQRVLARGQWSRMQRGANAETGVLRVRGEPQTFDDCAAHSRSGAWVGADGRNTTSSMPWRPSLPPSVWAWRPAKPARPASDVRRRVGCAVVRASGVKVYDDFAHHRPRSAPRWTACAAASPGDRVTVSSSRAPAP